MASLYECANDTKTINLAVKRYTNRFPKQFMFGLTEGENKFIGFKVSKVINNTT